MKVPAGQAMQTQASEIQARQSEQQLRQSWRQSWERAQWEWNAQTRSTALGIETPVPLAEKPANALSPQASTFRVPAAAFTQAPIPVQAEVSDTDPAHRAIVEIISRQTGVPQEEIALVPSATQASMPNVRVARTAVATAPLRQAFGDLAQSPTMVVVAVDGRQLVVTVRDTTLSQADQQNLVKRLRAELHARGFELAGVWINGCAWDVGAAQPRADVA